MVKVICTSRFIDKYSGDLVQEGTVLDVSEERAAELKEYVVPEEENTEKEEELPEQEEKAPKKGKSKPTKNAE